MKLLIVTQAVDTEDPTLGFFVRWIEEIAKRVERVEVICLKEGKHDGLPQNVRVHSLGKEKGPPRFARRLRYAIRFKWLAWRLRHDYDAVFVHMNQEYLLIAGLLWKILGRPIYMWRNYHGGTLATDVAMAFCTKIFCTSKFSYTAKDKKTELMPVGVDTERFSPDTRISPKKHSVLFLSGMWPSKRPEVLVDALAQLAGEGWAFTADFYGSPLPQTRAYYESVKDTVRTLKLDNRITFYPGPPNHQTPDIFRSHEIFVNCSPSGMFDKTIFEAAACGALVVASSADFASLVDSRLSFPDNDAAELARRIAGIWALAPEEKSRLAEHLKDEAGEQSLSALAETFVQAIH